MYEENSHATNGISGFTELCVISISPGIDEMFTTNITVNMVEGKIFFHSLC